MGAAPAGCRLLMLLAVVSLVVKSSAGQVADQTLGAPSSNIGSGLQAWLHSPLIQGDDSALVNAQGHVTVVSLIQANSAYSRRQAERLSILSNGIKSAATGSEASAGTGSEGGNGVGLHVIGINSRNFLATQLAGELNGLVNFTVYQSTQQNDHWSRLGGYKDDVFVYDRCGGLAYYIPFPRSYVPYGFVEAAILSTMHDNPCAATWQLLTAATSTNCTNSTDSKQASPTSGGTEARAEGTDSCTAYTRHRCIIFMSRDQGSVAVNNNSIEWRLAARCCRRYRHHHQQHHHHPGNHQAESSQSQHQQHADNRRCLCLPTSSNSAQHSCVCRHPNVASPTNCYCTLTSGDFARHCTSWRNEDWSTSGSDRVASTCSCNVEQIALASADQCSCEDRPVPYGRHAGLSSTSSELWRPASRPALWQHQASWQCPPSAAGEQPASWSWRVELGGSSSGGSSSPVSWLWANHPGRPAQAPVQGQPWSWSVRPGASSTGSESGRNVVGWQWRERVASWSGQALWEPSPSRTEWSWQGCLLVWGDDGSQLWRPAEAWSTSGWRATSTSWQQMSWSWDSREARRRLWRQNNGQTLDWQQSVWRGVDGWRWQPASGDPETNVFEEWSRQNRAKWANVWGWKWGRSFVVGSWS